MKIWTKQPFRPLEDRGPLRVMFVVTSMPVGGAETLLVNLIRHLDRDLIIPEVGCMKDSGPLGIELAEEIPVHANLLKNKYDLGVVGRLATLLRKRACDAVVTVTAGDNMFWGRLAAKRAGLPVICSALHSTGWPDGVGFLNHRLTPLTDAFIAVAESHGRFLHKHSGFPANKICVIPNGIDVDRFQPTSAMGKGTANVAAIRARLGLPDEARVCGIVAALRPEKNHHLFIKAAAKVRRRIREAHFVIIGDGPLRGELESLAAAQQMSHCVHFLGNRTDIPECLQSMDVFALTSDNEASPVSIMEAMACQLPVVATNVGSVAELVTHGKTGWLAAPRDCSAIANYLCSLLVNGELRMEMGLAARSKVVQYASLQSMVSGYQNLIRSIYAHKIGGAVPETAAKSPVLVK